MSLLNSYIRTAVIQATGIVALVLLGVECFMEFISQLPDIGQAHYTLGYAFLYVLTQLPLDLYQLFPMAGFLGCLIGLGRLASSSQLIVMRASGMSMLDITWAVIKAACLMLVIVTIVGEFVAPVLEGKGAQMKAIALMRETGLKALGGIWLRDATSFIHIGSVDTRQSISQVSRFEIDNHHLLLSADYAPTGEYVNQHWQLSHVHASQFTPEQVRQAVLPTLPLNIVFNPVLLEENRKNVDQQSITELYHSIAYRQKVGLETSPSVFAFWQRLVQPFATIVMICLGVPFIFGSLRSASTGFRILTGVIVGFAFYMLNQFFGPFAMVYQIPPVLVALIPTVLFAVGCVMLLRRSWY